MVPFFHNSFRIAIGGDSLYHSKTKKKTVEKSNLVLAVPWHTEQNQLPFKIEANNLWGNDVEVDWRNAMAYDATQAIIEVLKQISLQYNPQNLSQYRQNLIKILSDSNNFSAKGTTLVKFSQKGERNARSLDDLGVLVKVQCNNSIDSSCNFIRHKIQSPTNSQTR